MLIKSTCGYGQKWVSKKISIKSKNNPWILACGAAKTALNLHGFHVFKKGTPLYNLAKEIHDGWRASLQSAISPRPATSIDNGPDLSGGAGPAVPAHHEFDVT